MENLNEQYFNEDELGNYTLEDIEEDFAECKVMTRDTPIYSQGIYKILYKNNYKKLIQEKVETLEKDTILEKMPNNARKRKSVPSIQGQYLTVKECTLQKKDNGEYDVKTIGNTHVIPVEFIIKPLTKNQAIIQLMD